MADFSAPASGPAPASGVLGCGHRLPSQVRRNDDPIFRHLERTPDERGISEADLFVGLDERRCLAADEPVEPLVVQACRDALAAAGVAAADVDRMYGYVSVPDHLTPNPLFAVHSALGLPGHATVVPVNGEFSNFSLSLALACDAVDSGRARYVLVACGSSWTRHLDYTKGHAFTAGDGAGAAVVGPGGRLRLVDLATRTYGEHYAAMQMSVRPVSVAGRSHVPVGADNLPIPTYQMNAEGVELYLTVMKDGLPELVHQVLGRHGLDGGDIALITHQGSRSLLTHWADRIKPAQHLETLATYGNLVLATYPVNLSHYFDRIQAGHVVIAAVGPGFHLSVVLLRRA